MPEQLQEVISAILANPLALFVILVGAVIGLTAGLGVALAFGIGLLDRQIRRWTAPGGPQPAQPPPAAPATGEGPFPTTRAGHRAAGPGAAIFTLLILTVSVLAGLAVRIMPLAASDRAPRVDVLFNTMFGIAAAIFLLVEGVLLYSAIRFRRRKADNGDGLPMRGSNRLEIAWTLVPTLIVLWLGAYSFQIFRQTVTVPPNAMVIEVISRQFQWEYRYPDLGVTSNDLYLPQGQPVRLLITSLDVLHSFWVPAFRVKQDAIPMGQTEATFTPDLAGRFRVVCAELCGAGHARMGLISHVVVQSRAEFDAWVAQQQDTAGRPPDPVALITKFGCNTCHTLAAAGATGEVGPPLDGIGTRAATRVPGLSAEEYIRQSIVEPNAQVVEGFPPGVMPPDFEQRMRPEELEALVTFLSQQ